MACPGLRNHPARVMVYDRIAAEGGSVLDVGCGLGWDYPHFIKRGLEYKGVDITPKFVKRFRRRCPEVDVRIASALEIPFTDGSFTSVYAGGVLPHMHPEEYPLAIEEMWRVASNLMVFTLLPFSEKDKISLGKTYNNKYSKASIMNIISQLEEVINSNIEENIRGKGFNPITIIMVEKK